MSTGVNGLSPGVEKLKNLFFPANIHPFELSRVKLYGSDVKGNKNYFELFRGSFELSRVRVNEGKITVNV